MNRHPTGVPRRHPDERGPNRPWTVPVVIRGSRSPWRNHPRPSPPRSIFHPDEDPRFALPRILCGTTSSASPPPRSVWQSGHEDGRKGGIGHRLIRQKGGIGVGDLRDGHDDARHRRERFDEFCDENAPSWILRAHEEVPTGKEREQEDRKGGKPTDGTCSPAGNRPGVELDTGARGTVERLVLADMGHPRVEPRGMVGGHGTGVGILQRHRTTRLEKPYVGNAATARVRDMRLHLSFLLQCAAAGSARCLAGLPNLRGKHDALLRGVPH